MTAKLWGGRFKKGLDEDAKKLSYSFHIDQRLFDYDIRVNSAHSKALRKAGILTEPELKSLLKILSDLKKNFKGDEDIHSSIERQVTEKLGDLGKKLHTGKSRNDQVVTDVRLFVKDECQNVIGLLNQTIKSLAGLAKKHADLVFPGFTHFQPAQPVLLAHHMLAYAEQFLRDRERFQNAFKAADVCPLGSGALAGTNYPLDRQLIAKELGFSKISQNSMDAVSDRDFLLDFVSASATCMAHLSRACEELVLWSSPLIGFVVIGDEFTTGSSLMPQKKNPDIAELIRGKTGRVHGHLAALYHILKALPLTYNRDLQEDKEILFDTVDTLSMALLCFAKMLGSLEFQKEAIQSALEKGHLLATELADYLVRKGLPFRQCHELTGQIVLYAIEKKKTLSQVSLKEFQKFSPAIKNDIYDSLSFASAISGKNVVGGTAANQVKFQLRRIEREIS